MQNASPQTLADGSLAWRPATGRAEQLMLLLQPPKLLQLQPLKLPRLKVLALLL